MEITVKFWKFSAMVCGGFAGWFIGEFKPTFPLAIVAVVFILYDAWTASKQPSQREEQKEEQA